MKTIIKLILCSLILLAISACYQEEIKPSVISPDRIAKIEVKCRTLNNSTKTIQLEVLDVTANSVKKIFRELFKNNFPIYAAIGYENRAIVNSTTTSLHAYGGAIDINELMNPYYLAPRGTISIEPKRFADRAKDEKEMRSYLNFRGVVDESEIKAIMGIVIQEPKSDDWFINRNILRTGMLTSKEAKIFAELGFTIWGGTWKQMDFMHFQIPRKLAEQLASVSKEEGEIIWKNHLLTTNQTKE